MFENLHNHAKSLHGEMVGVFWLILPCLVSIIVVLEIAKNDDEGPNIRDILKRTVLCILMLISFDYTVSAIAMVSDEITHLIKGDDNVFESLKQFGPTNSDSSMFDIREHIVYFFAIAAYLVAYIGFFASTALVHFVWAILYITSPLLILCYVTKTTASITGNLYRGLINVATWKIVWTLLGSLLLKMSISPKEAGMEDYFLAMVINLLIGLCMLLVPLFTRSLISDGLQSASSGLAAAPGLLTAKAASMALKKYGSKGLNKLKNGVDFSTKPLRNPLTSRAKVWNSKMRLKQRFNKAKRNYRDLGNTKEWKEMRNRQNRRSHAIRQNYKNKSKKGVQNRKRKKR